MAIFLELPGQSNCSQGWGDEIPSARKQKRVTKSNSDDCILTFPHKGWVTFTRNHSDFLQDLHSSYMLLPKLRLILLLRLLMDLISFLSKKMVLSVLKLIEID